MNDRDDWDSFVAERPWGLHEQTSLWAEVKAADGWRAERSVIRRDGKVVGGFQMLWRPLRSFARIAYISKGPVLTPGSDAELLEQIVARIRQTARLRRIAAVVVQLPPGTEAAAEHARWSGFLPNKLVHLVCATHQLDLSLSEDEILAQMRRYRRRNIRAAVATDLSFREGGERDLGTFFDLMLAICQRRKLAPNPSDAEALARMWRVYQREDMLRLFLTSRDHECICACLVITMGDCATIWKIGWSGAHATLRPNDALHWRVIQWAKENGFSHFDFAGIDPRIVEQVSGVGAVKSEVTKTPSFYKLGFGGETVPFPESRVYIPNPLLRLAYRAAMSLRLFAPLSDALKRMVS